ncbi:hypothetical protein OESDEN_23557 [Oesophagostomum dentatum]|uniref:F-box domain protein n=1 Tax=Oesophagostomum dentatum TaxID=61180 RepID=A0A0B1RUR5_OESDE|nr:hypothetical protein OESDEN_23557 [Oesophagostomum dentatum]
MEDQASSMEICQADVFERWNDLPRHLKVHVLQNLPYPTLRNFMFLGKECFQLASEIETEAFAVFLQDIAYLKDEDDEDNEYNGMEEGTVELSVWYIPPHLRKVPNSFEPYQLLFTRDKSGGCILRRVREGTQHKSYGKEVRYAEETTFAAALRSFFQLTRNIKAKELSVEVERLNPDLERALKQQTTARFSCKTFLIRTEDRALPPLLYPFIPAGCSLQVYTFPFPKPDDIFIESSCFDLELVSYFHLME